MTLSAQTWLEMSPKSLLKTFSFVATKASGHVLKSCLNIWYCRHKHGWRCPDFLLKVIVVFFSPVSNTIKNPLRFGYNHPFFVTTNTGGDVPTPSPTYPILTPRQRLEIVSYISINLQWCHWLASLCTCESTTFSSMFWVFRCESVVWREVQILSWLAKQQFSAYFLRNWECHGWVAQERTSISFVLKCINKYVQTFFLQIQICFVRSCAKPRRLRHSYAKLSLNRVLSFKMHFSPRSRVSFHAKLRAAFISFYFKSGIPVFVLAFHIGLKWTQMVRVRVSNVLTFHS